MQSSVSEMTISPVVFRIVFDDEFRHSFLNNPDSIQEQYDLSMEDMDLLSAFSPEKIEALANLLSSVDLETIIAATWCNNTPITP